MSGDSKNTKAQHAWKLVAPWYRWRRQFAAEGKKPWETRPVFQKFDETDFVKSFVADPQRSLRFLEDEDTVFNTTLHTVPTLVTGPLMPPNRFTQLYAPKTEDGIKATSAQEARLVPTGIRKLYLSTHKRSYLVVCELHCYAPGFPTATRDQVCQSGFVLRRRTLKIPPGVIKKELNNFRGLIKQTDSLRGEIAFWERSVPATGIKAKFREKIVTNAAASGALAGKLSGFKTTLAQKEDQLLKWQITHGVTSVLEGWIPGDVEHIGSWEAVEETPAQTNDEAFPRNEAVFPMYALFPDPKIPDHSAKGKNIYFGVVPTSVLDTDRYGASRLDSDSTYEIRCFVRRHKTCCPRLDMTPDCHGELIWSERTEPFRLASATDLQGTSNRPITIKMPDLKELAAQASALPANKLAPVRVVHPQSMSFKVEDGKASGGGIGGFQICFISIPLITIVAMFVLNLFLPIVVFLFGLFFLLKLKFCIPPSISFGAGLFAKLDLALPAIEANASLDVDSGLDGLGVNFTANLNTELRNGIVEEQNLNNPDAILSLKDFSNAALLPVGKMIYDAKAKTDSDMMPTVDAGMDLNVTLDLEPRVEVAVR